MAYYIIIYIILLFSLFLKEAKGKRIGWFVFIIFFIMTTFRHESVGVDTINYLNYTGERRETEFVYIFIYGLNLLGYNISIIHVMSIVTYLCCFLCILKNRLDVRYFALFFFLFSFFFESMNISRQIASISVLSLFIPYIFERDFKKSLLFFVGVVLASGFHYTTLFMILLYGLRYININLRTAVPVALLLSILLLFDIIPIDVVMLHLLPDDYSGYSNILEKGTISFFGYIYRIVLLIFQLGLLGMLRDKKDVTFFFLYIIVTNASIGMNPIVSRIFLTFTFMSIIICSRFFYDAVKLKNKKRIMMFIVYVLLNTYFAFSFLRSASEFGSYKFADNMAFLNVL